MINGFNMWGRFDWLCTNISVPHWHLVSCCSFEERCLSVPQTLCSNGKLSGASIISIFEHQDSRFYEPASQKINKHKANLMELGHPNFNFYDTSLFSKLGDIRAIYNSIVELSQGDVVLDISTFPKRFFFPLINWLYNNDRITNLVVTYTRPKQYRLNGLCFDPEPSSTIPGCSRETEDEPEIVVVATGYMYLGFPGILKDYSQSMEVEAFLPFPPGPPNYQKNWSFLQEIEDCLPADRDFVPIRVSAINVPEIFNKLVLLSDNGQKPMLLAPYGPKPMSLAMSIYKAITPNSSVIYTQPKSYHHDYSKGIREDKDGIEQFGYCLKVKGNKLYNIHS